MKYTLAFVVFRSHHNSLRIHVNYLSIIDNCLGEAILMNMCTIHRYRTTPKHRPSWWRHQMEIFSALLDICGGNSPVTGEFPSQRPVTQSFDVFFVLRLNKRLRKQSCGWWFETPSCSFWRHCNDHGTSIPRGVLYYVIQNTLKPISITWVRPWQRYYWQLTQWSWVTHMYAQILACRVLGAKLSYKQILAYCQLGSSEQTPGKFHTK